MLAFKKRTSEIHASMSFVKLISHIIKKEKEKKPVSEPDDSSITDSSDESDSDDLEKESEIINNK